MAELADAHDSKSCGAIHVGSTPTLGTMCKIKVQMICTFLYISLFQLLSFYLFFVFFI